MLEKGAKLLKKEIPNDFTCSECGNVFEIIPGVSTKESGEFSYTSFLRAVNLAKSGEADAIVTLPINKESWSKANVPFIGHTDALSKKAIMMLGCEKLFVILYTHHIPIKEIAKKIKTKKLKKFLLKVYDSLHVENIAVLGLNPHAGDNGVIGDEDKKIKKAIKKANKKLEKEIFHGPMVPDIAFTKRNREKYTHFVCMYHDQGLTPLKALYFDESINVSLNTGIIRTSVDHGTAFDIAYKFKKPLNISFINAIKYAIKLSLR
jgi:4-hydroxythreonine-4-phosphate dehydrogenase